MSRGALAVGAGALAACASPERPVHDWSTYTGPGAAHFQREEVALPQYPDPYERLNRAVFAVNEGLVFDVVGPLAQLYRAVTPSAARAGLARAFTNLLFPERLLANLLQAQWRAAWDETQRFALNTTLGLGGVRDAAQDFGITTEPEDLGRAFHAWGWRDAAYVHLPWLGPSTTREALGYGLGLGVDVTTYYFPSSFVREFNEFAEALPGLSEALESRYDPYELARLIYQLDRESAAPASRGGTERDGATETLGTALLTPRDPDFAARAVELAVAHPSTGRRVPYSLWLQPGAAAIDYVIPGLGGHRQSASAVAIAEAVFEAGSSAVTISSSLNFEFIASASSEALPGYLPADARDTHLLLDAIDRDLRARFPERLLGRRLGGISFGGITTLFIAAAQDPTLVDFEVYLAVNAPLSLEYGAARIDAFYNAPLEVPAAERAAWMEGLFRKALALADRGPTAADAELPFTSREAKFLIGLVFRTTLREVILQTQLRRDLGVLRAPLDPARRAAAYREIDQFSLTEYVYAFVLPYVAAKGDGVTHDEAGARELFRRCDVRALGPRLAANPRVRFATNRNDFLLAQGDLEWITALLGPDRVTVFERGGHLGNLYRDDIRAILAEVVRKAASRADR